MQFKCSCDIHKNYVSGFFKRSKSSEKISFEIMKLFEKVDQRLELKTRCVNMSDEFPLKILKYMTTDYYK